MDAMNFPRFKYPEVRRDETCVDNPNKVPDPYRWLEDPDAAETKQFVEAQNKVTFGFLESIPWRQKIKDRMTQLYNYPKYSCPFKRGNRYYYFLNTGLQNQAVMYYQESLKDEGKVFFDPNTLAADGTVALKVYEFSESGNFFAYGLSASGSDWYSIQIRHVQTNEVLPEKLDWVKFSSIAWTHDDKGFFYCRYPAPQHSAADKGTETDANLNMKVYYHLIGTAQSEDVLVFETPDQPKWMFGVEITDDGKYLNIEISESTAPVNRVYLANIQGWTPKTPLNLQRLIDNFDAEYRLVTNDDEEFYFRTNLNAPRNKLICINLKNPQQSAWREVIGQHVRDVMCTVAPVNGKYLITSWMVDVKELLHLYTLDGKFLEEVELPAPGAIGQITGRRKDTAFFYKFTSFLYPGTTYHYDFATRKSVVFRETKVPEFDSSIFHTQQVFYKSKDGEKIPMFLVHKKTLKRDGNAGCYLYGYGGFSIPIQPSFNPLQLVFLQHFDGVLAIANIRGGAEYGEDWHKAGIHDKKQNVFDDFISAAEWLAAEKYTAARKICIVGGSNGGLLVGACVTQRPDLFGAGIAQVGVFDMLRFHKFTIGYAWTADYGCADEPEQFKYLIKYSPLHNVKTGQPYPALMLTTGDHDDRVVPLHSFKFISEIQHKLGKETYQNAPLLIRIETKAGHGAGTPTTKIIEEAADRYAFFTYCLGLQWRD